MARRPLAGRTSDFFQSCVSTSIFLAISSVLKSPTTTTVNRLGAKASRVERLAVRGGQLLDGRPRALCRPTEWVVAVN